jgi:hypothetical protein
VASQIDADMANVEENVACLTALFGVAPVAVIPHLAGREAGPGPVAGRLDLVSLAG